MSELVVKALNILQKYIMNSVIDVTNAYFGGSVVFFVLIVVSFSLLILERNEMNSGYKLFFVYSVFGLLMFTYNPVAQWVVQNSSLAQGDSVLETFMLYPLFALIAYVLSYACLSIKKSIKKHIVIVFLSVLIAFAGCSAYYCDNVFNARNHYKVNPQSIEIANQVLNASGGKPATLYIFTPPHENPDSEVPGGTIYEGIHQYTAFINVYEYPTEDWYWVNYFMEDITLEGTLSVDYMRDYIADTFEQYDLDYFALPINDIVDEKMQYLGYQRVGEGGGYYIYSMEA